MRDGLVNEPVEVQQHLAELELAPEVLLEAVRMGEIARNLCTPNDPRSFPGQAAHARTVRGLRDQLLRHGWKRNDQRNFPTVVSPDGSFRIAVATGDENVGNPLREPKTKSPKGTVMEQAVACNIMQLLLPFPDLAALDSTKDEEAEQEVPIRNDCRTWILLFHRTRNKVHYELSLPKGFAENMQVDSWTTRILLGSIDIDPSPSLPLPDSGPDIDIQVLRK